MIYKASSNLIKSITSKPRNIIDRILFPYELYQVRKRCLFIHIPKTAGTSILQALGKKSRYGRQHFPYYIYEMANSAYYSSAFKFSFVRNPFDRCYSAYEYIVAGSDNTFPPEHSIMKLFDGFEDFLLNGLGQGMFRNHRLFLPQSQFVIDTTGEIVVDFLGRHENINHDFSIVANRLNLTNELQHLNTNSLKPKADYRLAYSNPATIEIIESLYKQDLTAFNYSFE